MHHPTDRIAHTMAFVTPVVEQWLEREIAQWVHPMKDRSDEPSHHERTLLPQSYISLLKVGRSKQKLYLVHICDIGHLFRSFYCLKNYYTSDIMISGVAVKIATNILHGSDSCHFKLSISY